MDLVVAVVCFAVVFAGGVFVGREYEQKIVAATLAEFAKVDAEAKSLVNRCFRYLSFGVRDRLKKLLG
jgi:hypothetical protein